MGNDDQERKASTEDEKDDKQPSLSAVDTGGGAMVGGDVDTGGGAFIGRDQNIFTEETAYNVHGLTNPYLGLRAFTYADRAIYAGREQLAQETIQRLTMPGAQQTILFITGASGSGKSSFAQAALIPLLEKHYAPYQKTVRHAIFRPSSQPMAMLRDALQKLHPDLTPEEFATNLPKDQINLLLIDQFEELFIQSDPSQRTPFCDFLANLPGFATCHTHILITLRVDYLDELFDIPPLWAIAKAGVELRTMHTADLRNAIPKPLQVNHPTKRFASELLDRLVEDASQDAALLPLLQVTLAELWRNGKLVLSNYHSLTDAIRQRAETVYTFRDHASADPKTPRSAAEQQELISILLDLINVSADDVDLRDVRQRRNRQELAQGSAQRPRLIEELVNARLLAAASETRDGEDVEVIDIIHESLIDNWRRLQKVVEEDRARLQRQARFKLWRDLWVQNGKDDKHLLLTDIQLAEAKTLADVNDIELRAPNSKEFYRRSLTHQDEIQQRQVRTFRNVAMAMGFLFLLAALAAGISFYLYKWLNTAYADLNIKNVQLGESNTKLNDTVKQRDQTVRDLDSANSQLQRTLAQTQRLSRIARARQLAAQSDAAVQNNYQLSLLLAAEALTQTWSMSGSLYSGAVQTALHARIEGEPGGLPLLGHEDQVRAVAFSPDGKWLASASLDHTLRLWSVDNWQAEPVVLRGHTDQVWSVAFSPDGKWLASASADTTLRLWSVDHWQTEPIVLHEYESFLFSLAFSLDGKWLASAGDSTLYLWSVNDWQAQPVVLREYAFRSVAFSPDGKWLAGASADTTLYLWSVNDWRAQPVILRGHTDGVLSIAFSPDSKWLVSASEDTTLRLWSVNDWQAQPVILRKNKSFLFSLAFSPDGKWLAGASADTTLRLWSVNDWQAEPVVLRGHTDGVWSVAFSPDGKWLVSASEDTTLRLWSVDHWRAEPVILRGHEVWSVAFSPDGKWLASASHSTLYLWSVDHWQAKPVVLRGHEDAFRSVTFSPDGKWLASASDSTLYLWSVDHWQAEPVVLREHEDAFSSVAFSPDGKWLVGAGWKTTLRLWSVDNWQAEPVVLREHEAYVSSVAFSSDGKWLASASDSALYLWLVDDWSAEPVVLRGHEDQVRAVAFSPDGKWLASASLDHTLRLWLVDDWQAEPVVLRGHEDQVRAMAFSPDGKWLASASTDTTLRLWSVDDWQAEPVILRGHGAEVYAVAFSPDGKWLASASRDFTLRVWTVSTDILFSKVCRLARRNFYLLEWLTYMGGLDAYRPTCPTMRISPDVLDAIRDEARQQIRSGQVTRAKQRLNQLNDWLQVNGQFKEFGVDVPTFVQGVATATTEAMPSLSVTPAPSSTPTPLSTASQAVSPLAGRGGSPLPTPTSPVP